jgi:hypothetical protein
MSKVLIHSDIHGRHRQVDEMLQWEEPYDKVIFLGDIFDQWSDGPIQALDAAHWLKEKLEDPRNNLCIGNHDQQYVWPNHPSWCWGITPGKSDAVRSVLTQADLDKLRPYHIEQGILFTHAGFDAYLPQQVASGGCEAPVGNLTAESVGAYLDHIWPEVCARYGNIHQTRFHPLLECGRTRGGTQRTGGITWQDFSDHTPLPLVGQVVGHSIMDNGPLFRFVHNMASVADETPMWRRAAAGKIKTKWFGHGWTLGLDCNNKWYGVLEDGNLTLKRVEWQRKWGDIGFMVTPTAESYTFQLKDNSNG